MDAPLPQGPDESNVARRGKIASLPLAIRNEINARLENGGSEGEILTWLNADKEARRIANAKIDNSEKLEKLGRAMFGEAWRSEQEYYDRFRYDI